MCHMNVIVLCFCVLAFCIQANIGRRDNRVYSYQFFRSEYKKSSNDYHYYDYDFYDDDKGTRWLCLFLGMCSAWYEEVLAQTHGIASVYEWKQLEFDYPSEADRQAAIAKGDFNEGHPVPIDVDIHYSGNNQNKIFITIPRFQGGVPATLGTVTERTRNGNPIIAPYPSWGWHQQPASCKRDRIVSVYRVKVDECGRVWVLDTGRLVDKRICPAQILAFDVKTNELLHRYEIPESQLQSTSILVTPVVDVRDPHLGCTDTFVYVADCQTMSIIVHDVRRHTSWNVIDKTMYPYPNFGTYHIAGQQFDLMDGILGMALSPYRAGEDRILFYHAMSSGTENWVYTSYLRNNSLFAQDPSAMPSLFNTFSQHRHTQVPAVAIDKEGIAYFGFVADLSLNCWNTNTEYGSRNIGTLAQNDRTLQFMSGIKVATNKRNAQELWFMTMRFQKVATGSLDTNEVNFRIQAAKVDDVVRNSKCANRPGPSHRPGYGYSYGKKHKREFNPVYFPSG